MKKKLVILDFDGVIYDVTKLQMEKIINSAKLALNGFEAKGNIPTYNFLKQCWGISIFQMTQEFIDKLYWNDDQANLFLYYERENKDKFVNHGLAHGFIPLINKLKKRGINISICSNRYSSSFFKLTRQLNLDITNFEFIILADSQKDIKKPNKKVLDPILNKYKRDEVVLVGDTIRTDLETAINAKIDFIGISSVLHTKTEFKQSFRRAKLKNNYFVLNKLTEIETLLV